MKRRSGHQTQWAAQFAVASELCKRGHQVALTLGNHPTVDLMVVSPNGEQFVVDVKGQYRRNFWPVKRQSQRDNFFYILAFVPDKQPNRFFIMTQTQVNDAIEENLMTYRARRVAKGLPVRDDMTGVEDRIAKQYEDAWDILPK